MKSVFMHINSPPYMNSNFFIVFSFQQNKRYSNGLWVSYRSNDNFTIYQIKDNFTIWVN